MITAASSAAASFTPTTAAPPTQSPQDPRLKQAFQDFVGQSFFGQMISSMRQTVKPSPYFHGGRAEEVFQKQLDQTLTEKISASSADQFAKPMFELFQLQRR
jgi:hypothetical protein